MSTAGGGQYAFVIETRDNLNRSWQGISDYGVGGGVAIGRGVEDDVSGSPKDFAQATIDAYLEQMVATSPHMVEYFLREDEDETEWRIQVWDVLATGYDQISTVPPPDDRVRVRLNYPLAMMADGIEPQAIVTLPNQVVRDRLRVKQKAHTAALGEGGPRARR